MTTRTSFTPEEWNLLRRTPLMAELAMVPAGPDESLAENDRYPGVGMMLGARVPGAENGLIDVLIADLATGGRLAVEPWEMAGKSPDEVRRHALDRCRRAAGLLDRKARPEESRAFKHWLAALGRDVADAARRGGGPGPGGTLTDLQRSLGLAA